MQRVRLKNIHLNNQMKRIEATLKQKEELAEGLHLIDFEQVGSDHWQATSICQTLL